MGNVSRKMETLRNNQKEMLEVRNTITEKKNIFDGLIRRAEEIISQFEDRSIELPKLKFKEKKNQY